jgi:hypothetical protein
MVPEKITRRVRYGFNSRRVSMDAQNLFFLIIGTSERIYNGFSGCDKFFS